MMLMGNLKQKLFVIIFRMSFKNKLQATMDEPHTDEDDDELMLAASKMNIVDTVDGELLSNNEGI